MRIARFFALLALAPLSAGAQNLPDKPIHLIVPSAPAGGTDILARNIAQKVGEKFGLTIVVDNKIGAGSLVGTDFVAKGPSDGSVLMMGGLFNMVMNSALLPNLPYDPIKDFVIVDIVSAYPFIAMTHPSLGAKTLRQFVDYAKARPGQLNLGSAGLGTLHHVWGSILTKSLGLDMTLVHYRGAAPAQQDLLAGRTQFLFDNLSAAHGLVEDGRLTALGVSSPVRSKLAPDVPTINESGLVDFVGESWFAVLAPSKLDPGARDALRKIIHETTHESAFVAIVERDGGRMLDIAPDKQADFLRGEIERWTALVRTYGIEVEQN